MGSPSPAPGIKKGVVMCYVFTNSPPQWFPRGTWGRSRPPSTGVSRVTACCLLARVAKAWVGLWRKPISSANGYPSPRDIIWKSPSLRLSVTWPPDQKTFFVFFSVLTLASVSD